MAVGDRSYRLWEQMQSESLSIVRTYETDAVCDVTDADGMVFHFSAALQFLYVSGVWCSNFKAKSGLGFCHAKGFNRFKLAKN